MNIIETTFERLPRERLVIGFEGENLRATVRIDCASVFAEYPNATPALIVKPLFADAYPVVVDRNGTDVDWLITSEILSFTGDGEIQLVFYKDQVICKSAVSKIRVSRSLTVTGEKPDPIARWEDAANQKLAEVDAVIVSIDEMDATAHGLPEGSAPTAEVQTVDDHKRILLGIPAGATGAKGDKGDKGDRGEVGATPDIDIGTVETLPAGSEATASMSGTAENPLLNLGIPQGIQGVKGDRGEKGDTGTTGATGATPDFSIGAVSTLPAGSSATAEITGTAENPVLSLGIPQGVQGVQGEKGEKGDPGEGVPTGGITGQVLAKASDTDYDTEWIHVAPVIKNTASGAIASFPDGADGHPVDELKVQIEPVQDLHGYSNPWPAGGGKNIAPYSIADSFVVGYASQLWKNGYVSNRATSTSTGFSFSRTNNNYGCGIVLGKLEEGQAYTIKATRSNLDWKCNIITFDADAVFSSETGVPRTIVQSNVIIENGYTFTAQGGNIKYALNFYSIEQDQLTLEVSNIQLEKGQTATEWTPYSNICPISGWDGVQVWDDPAHGGMIEWNQMCDENKFLVTGGASYTLTDHRLIIQGSVQTINVLFIPRGSGWYAVAGHKYLVTGIHKKDGVSAFFYNGTNVQTVVINSDGSAIVESAYSGDTQFYLNRGSSGNVDIDAIPQFFDLTQMFGAGNEPSTVEEFKALFPADYYPYNAGEITTVSAVNGNPYRHYSITLPTEAGTVYGGELTVNADGSGSLVVDRKSIVYDGSDNYTWTYASNYHCMICGNQISDIEYDVKISDYQNSYGIVVHRTAISLKQLQFGSSLNPIEGVASSVEEWKSRLNANPIQVVYPLATPITYTLTASEIRTLLGQNNIWADTGDVAVKYNADTKLYIDNKITQAIAAALNS